MVSCKFMAKVIIEVKSLQNNDLIGKLVISNSGRDKNQMYVIVDSIDDIKNGVDTNIKVSLVWENIETNNEVDTSFSKPDTYISIPVTVNFSQYLGEELVEYTE